MECSRAQCVHQSVYGAACCGSVKWGLTWIVSASSQLLLQTCFHEII